MGGVKAFKATRQMTAAVAAALLLSSLIVSAAGPARAAACTMVPDIAHITVNQGTDSYSPLAWGKEAIVRAHMLLPSCAAPGSIDTTGGTLTVKLGAVTLATLSPHVPYTSSQDITACCTPSSNSSGDPKFLVPAAVMSQGAGDVALTFSVTVNYKAGTSLPSSVTEEVIKVVGKRANPLRALFVPMGNKTLPDQWTTTDTANLEKAIGTASRMLPVALGTDSLSVTTSNAGIRWDLGKTLLDLGPGTAAQPGLNVITRSDGKFCGQNSNFEKIKLALVEYVHAWNSANPTAPVDRAMGVIGPNASVGSEAGGCADGTAVAPGTVAWSRITGSTDRAASMAGSVLTQEWAHNFGAVAPGDPRYIGWHSLNAEAETAGRAYNLVTREWMSSDRTALRLVDPWNDSTTLLEAPDWAWISCALGGSATGCAAPGSTGSPAASTTLFRVTGTTGGTKQDTSLVSNKVDGGTATQEAAESSDPAHPNYYITFRSGSETAPGPILESYRAPVTFGATHDHDGDHHSSIGSVDASFPFEPNATLVELWKGTPNATATCAVATECLYSAPSTSAPEAIRIEVSPTDWTYDRNVTNSTGLNEIDPSLSQDGEYLAYTEMSGNCSTLVVRKVSGGPEARLQGCDRAAPGQPAMSPDTATIAFVRDGDLWRVAFDKTTMTFGTETKIYSCVREAGACVTGGFRPPLTGPASRPNWSPTPVTPRTDQWLVFSVQGDVYRLFPFRGLDVGGTIGVAQPERLTNDERSTQPTVGPVNSDGTQFIAFKRDTADGPAIMTMDISKSSRPVRQVVLGGRLPSWGGELIAYEKVTGGEPTGNLAIVNPDSLLSESITTAGTDTAPALVAAFGRTMGIERALGTGAAKQKDIFLGRTTASRDITLLGRDADNGDDTSGFIYLRCARSDIPVDRALSPTHPDPLDPTIVAYTTDNHETRLDCQDGPVVGMISDGFSLSNKVTGGTTDPGFKPPVAAILSPQAAASAIAYRDRPIALHGYAWDAEGSVLPASALKWALKINNGNWLDVPGTGGMKDVRPSDIGLSGPFFPAGRYTARLTATDGEGRTDEAFVEFSIAGVEATVNFDPDTLYVPSSGNPVTLTVSGVTNLSAVKSARITAIDGVALSTPLGGTWKYDAKTGTGTLQVDRATLTSMIPSDRVGERVLITVEGCSSSPWNCGAAGDIFSGADPAAPVTSPSQ